MTRFSTNRTAFLVIACLFTMRAEAWAMPSQITYQGTLKEKGIPSNGTKTMFFRITNADGTQVYWSSGNLSVSVANGLFSTALNPTGVNWEAVIPYIEVSIEGQVLVPREPISATVYATLSSSIVDGAISPAKVATGYGLVPAGMVAMFTVDCPTGWARFSALDNAFPMGSLTYGNTGGNATHSHSLIITESATAGGGNAIGSARGSMNNGLTSFSAGSGYTADFRSADTNSQSNLPPYLSMVYCQKS
jgi:hypothetical protein